MSRYRFFLFTLCLLLTSTFLTGSVMAEAPSGYDFLPYDKGIQLSQKTGKKIFLYYGREGCGFCDKTNKESFSKKNVKKAITDNFVLVYVDAEGGRRMTLPSGERITEMQLGTRLNALVTPVFMFLHPNGEKIVKVPGFQPAVNFLTMAAYVKGGHFTTQSLSQFQSSQK